MALPNLSSTTATSHRALLESDRRHTARQLLNAISTDPQSNVVTSPVAVTDCLTLAASATGGDTAAKLEHGLGWELPLPKTVAALGRHLQENPPDKQLARASCLWADAGMAVRHEYTATLEEHLGTGCRTLSEEVEDAVAQVNEWAAEETDGFIRQVVTKQDLQTRPGSWRVLLTAACSLQAKWAGGPMTLLSSSMPFMSADGTTPAVSMLNKCADLPYVKTASYEAAKLAYEGGRLSLVLLRPRQSSAEPGAALQEAYATLGDKTNTSYVNLTFPKFEFEVRNELRQHLGALGAGALTDGDADFTGLCATQPVAFSDFFEKARIRVDEEGTRAASVAVMSMRCMCAAPVFREPVDLTLDKPFWFSIQDGNNMVFAGRLACPAATS